ncbi:MAG: PAS domain S-box protein [Gemmataceae bacterium]|nr:PAS domain S-box protein [Gemmataceae bacterium]
MGPLAAPSLAQETPTEWMRALLDALDDAVFVHDLDGRIVEVNAAACRRLGYTRDEFLRLTTRDIDAPEFARGFAERSQRQLAQGALQCEGVHRTKDGRLIPVDINTSQITLESQPAILAVMRDISERKLAEEKLARQSQLLQSILDNMGDAIVAFDNNARISMYNPAAERLFGARVAEQEFQLFPAEPWSTPVPLPLARCIRGEAFDDEEYRVCHAAAPEGRWLRMNGRPLRDGRDAIQGGVLLSHDITERKKSERRLQAQYSVSQAIASGGTLAELAGVILQTLGQALDMDVAVLWIFDGHDQALRCCDVWHDLPDTPREFMTLTKLITIASGVDVPGDVCLEGTAQARALTEPEAEQYSRRRLAWQAGLRGVTAFPIHSKLDVVGVLEFFSRSVPRIDEDLQSMMYALGGQIGQMLHRQKVEQALRDSEALYQSLVQSLPQNIFRKDCAGRVTFGNQQYCETLKMPLEKLLGKTDYDLFPVELARKYTADDQRVLTTGQPLETVEEHVLPGGATIFVQVVKTPVRDAEGEIVGTQGLFWDVTEKHRSAQILADSELRYRQLTEATLDAIVLVDQDARITLFNPAAERMFGWQAADVIGQPSSVLVPEDYRLLHEQGFRRYVETRQPRMIGRTVEVQARRKDGSEFPVEIALSALSLGSDPKGPVQFLAAIRDLTERNKMRSVLVHSEKLASIGLLSAGVAHEINNPLAFVGNNLVVLERDCKGMLPLFDMLDRHGEALARHVPDLWKQYQELAIAIDLTYIRENLERLLHRTREGTERVTRIVQSLRGLARTDAPRAQDTSLPDLIDASLEILRGRFRRSGIEVEQEHAAGVKVQCVPTQISQVVLNLLVNAFQAVERHRIEGGRIWVRTRPEGDEMLLEVADNGPGIDPAHFAKIFDPFFTTKDVGEGTGLGLSISHNIVAAHGGRIEVGGALGQGATFRVYLPLRPARRSEARE